jgi:hypothetical protein
LDESLAPNFGQGYNDDTSPRNKKGEDGNDSSGDEFERKDMVTSLFENRPTIEKGSSVKVSLVGNQDTSMAGDISPSVLNQEP